ncbi:hypothetical protein F5X99DRAFT_345287 [Biscogniauxia marginata]|nr:hypothetical protein F5X99DRAFT_345287 [Biscogniauxia marginata]
MAAVATANSHETRASSSSASPSRPLTPIQEHDAADHASPSSSKTSDSGSVTSVVKFYIDSDTMVLVKKDGDEAHYQVSSCSIALASPVWCSILYGQNSKERPAKGEWSIALEGDPKALDTIFRIVHYEFNKVPTNPSLEDLFEITCLTSQYKCTHLIYPWVHSWLVGLSGAGCFTSESGFLGRCHKAIWVAWVVGDINLFEDATNALIITCSVGADGSLINKVGIPLKDMIFPPDLLDSIVDIRLTTISTILEAVGLYVTHLSSGSQDSNTSYCKVGKNVRECEAMMLGSALPELVKAELYPVPKASDVALSIQDLKDRLDHIETIPYVGRDWMPHQSHEPCCLIIRELISECIRNMRTPLKDDYLDHLSLQANVSGIRSNGPK